MVDELPQSDCYPPIERPEVLALIPRTAGSFLDVGCGSGGFGRQLRTAFGPQARIVGVETVPSQAAAARDRGFDEVIDGYFPDAMTSGERFDVISFNDVLEHTYDPWGVLARCHEFLNPGGVVVAAIPNIQYAPAIARLVRGRFDYTDTGLMDRTHVRFFTRPTMVEMFEKAGFTVTACVGAHSCFAEGERLHKARFARRLFGDAQFLHFVLVGQPARFGR